MSVIDEAIKKYGGGDAAYEQKLKTGIRDAMGYSNYVAKMQRETGKVASIGDIKGLSPSGINARISSRFGMQDERIRGIADNAGAIDSAAGSLASAQAARGRAAAAAGQDISFDPKSQFERELNKYIQNPKNPDGSTKSLQQFEAEMREKFGAVLGADGKPVDANKPYDAGNGNVESQDILTPDDIKAGIDARIPKDYIGKEVYYQAIMGGATDKQAKELQAFDEYKTGRMEEAPKALYELLHPTAAQDAEVSRQQDNASTMANERVTDENGESAPKYTIEQIVAANPSITEEQAKKKLKSSLQADVADDIPKLLGSDGVEAIRELIADNNYMEAKDTDEYKKLLSDLGDAYADYYSKAEIESIIYKTLHAKP